MKMVDFSASYPEKPRYLPARSRISNRRLQPRRELAQGGTGEPASMDADTKKLLEQMRTQGGQALHEMPIAAARLALKTLSGALDVPAPRCVIAASRARFTASCPSPACSALAARRSMKSAQIWRQVCSGF